MDRRGPQGPQRRGSGRAAGTGAATTFAPTAETNERAGASGAAATKAAARAARAEEAARAARTATPTRSRASSTAATARCAAWPASSARRRSGPRARRAWDSGPSSRLRTSFQEPRQKPGRSLVTWIGRCAGDSSARVSGTRRRRPSDGGPGRRAPAPAPPRAGRPRRRSRWRRPVPVGRSRTRSGASGVQAALPLPGDQGRAGRSSSASGVDLGQRPRGRRAAGPASRRGRPSSAASDRSGQSSPSSRRRKATRSRRRTAASPQGRAASPSRAHLVHQGARDQRRVGPVDAPLLDDQRARAWCAGAPRSRPAVVGLQPLLDRHPVGEGRRAARPGRAGRPAGCGRGASPPPSSPTASQGSRARASVGSR